MPLAGGTKLGPYEILSPLGSGGMGEVYRARDTKLRRQVAIKVLRQGFAEDKERLGRFEREARLLAALNHPNIASIYDLEECDGVKFLILELVEGGTLAERIGRGPIPVEEALGLFKQVAEALEAAHEKGVIHRDLKPANIKVTPEGKVKVLDFGLAKGFGETRQQDLSEFATLAREESRGLVLLGTAAYMSPEQVRGKALDHRTDIWSFGCVLYEALSGRAPFRGETVSDTLAAILQKEPDWRALPEETPLGIRRLLSRCLKKDLHQRLQHSGDVRIQIEDALIEPATATGPKASLAWRHALPWVMPGLLAILLGLTLWHFMGAASKLASKPVMRTMIPVNDYPPLTSHPSIAISPDGRRLVLASQKAGSSQLYVREMDGLEFTPLADTEGSGSPFFSPDGGWVGFSADGKLKKIPVAGGFAQAICDASHLHGASWLPDDTILFSGHRDSGIWRVPAAGGPPEQITRPAPDQGERSHTWPAALPGGKAFLFTIVRTDNTFAVAAGNIGSNQHKILVDNGSHARYLPTGQIVYAVSGTLVVAPFDPNGLEVLGGAHPIPDEVMILPENGGAWLSYSDNGTLVYVPSALASASLVKVGRDGAAQSVTTITHKRYAPPIPRISPRGDRLALDISDGRRSDIWIYELERAVLSRLTFDGIYVTPVWSPDGQRLAFAVFGSEPKGLFSMRARGAGQPERILSKTYAAEPASWSSDGSVLAFDELHPQTKLDIWMVSLGGDRKPTVFLATPFNEHSAMFSPDGRWIAYVSDESGRYEVYVRSYPHSTDKWQISIDGGDGPIWNPTGRELFYQKGGKLLAVAVETEPEFRVGRPQQLFEGPYDSRYDVAPDGNWFITVETQLQAVTQIHVVADWFEELKRLVLTR